eukprot:Hpha_TRINITY_DN16824_c0_g3::TRINITY_DN16824_c0_g3_i1::g.150096::m.150096
MLGKADVVTLVLAIVVGFLVWQNLSLESTLDRLNTRYAEHGKRLAELERRLANAPKASPQVPTRNVPPPSSLPTVGAAKIQRGIYGGSGDMPHLGGFTANDTGGQSPPIWAWMLKVLNVRSFLDVGCGRGISTSWMLDRGVDVLCVEGSSDAVKTSLLPRQLIVQHDYSAGPMVPERTFDVAWAVEFLEHVGRQHTHNYMETFKRAALVFVTHSDWGGWHHVEVHSSWWWQAKFEAHGFVFNRQLTEKCQGLRWLAKGQGGHMGNLQVFINPQVAGLPEHAHLLGGPGCCCRKGTSERYVCGAQGHDPSMGEHDWLDERFLPVWAEKTPWDKNDREMQDMTGFDGKWRRDLERDGEPNWNKKQKENHRKKRGHHP